MNPSSSNSGQLNKDTGVPHRLALSDVLGGIELSPADIGALLGTWSSQFLGGANHNLGLTLRDHAAMVSDPTTYGFKPDEPSRTDAEAPYEPPATPAYAKSYTPTDRASRREHDGEVLTGRAGTEQTTAAPLSHAPEHAPVNPSPPVYTPPGGPPVDPKYQAPYTSPAAPTQPDVTHTVVHTPTPQPSPGFAPGAPPPSPEIV